MPFKTPITIQEAVRDIDEHRYLLPAIQRELVWGNDRVMRLFDSLMRDYPINSFLFWKVPDEKKHEFQFYEFIRNYHERNSQHNPKADVHGSSGITAILDGQQRLTSLYIGLKGSSARKIKWKKWDNPNAFPRKKLYLNLAMPLNDHERFERDMHFDFAFLTAEEAAKETNGEVWFKVGRILDFDKGNPSQINKFLKEQGLEDNEFSGECLFKLRDVIQIIPLINYFEEEGGDLERALNIFVRTNSSGVPLSASDLLLSIATSQWKAHDAREEINYLVDTLNEIGNGFNFDKNFVLKASLVLTDEDVRFRLKNFSMTSMLKIEDNWNSIKEALTTAVKLVSSFGFDAKRLTANNAIIPIAYYLKRINAGESYITHSKHEEDRNSIGLWLRTALLKQLFSGQSDSTLRDLREAINGVSSFKDGQLARKIRFDEEEIFELLDTSYGTARAFLILSLLYPTLDYRNLFHMDHIHPKKLFMSGNLSARCIPKDEHSNFRNKFNRIGNVQLLEGPHNQEKAGTELEKWLNAKFPKPQDQGRAEFMEKHYIPRDADLSFEKFPKMFESREGLIAQRLKELLQQNDTREEMP